MNARTFFFASAALLCLVLAYHVAATRSEAQSGLTQFAGVTAIPQGGTTGYVVAITVDGDLYTRSGYPVCNGSWSSTNCGWVYAGNVLGGPVNVEGTSFGKIKAKSR